MTFKLVLSIIVEKSEMIPGSFQIDTFNNLLTFVRISAVDYHSVNMIVTYFTYITRRILVSNSDFPLLSLSSTNTSPYYFAWQ
jgi:hypothetical protein